MNKITMFMMIVGISNVLSFARADHLIRINPGSSVKIPPSSIPTEVMCLGNTNDVLTCTIGKNAYGNFAVFQNGKQISSSYGSTNEALKDLLKLRSAGICP